MNFQQIDHDNEQKLILLDYYLSVDAAIAGESGWVGIIQWYSDDNVKHPGMRLALDLMLRSPDYSIKDIFNTIRGFQRSYTQRIIEDFAEIDFSKTIERIDIPVVFIHGRKDVHVYGELTDKYYNSLVAPAGKELLWMEKSSHMFHPDDAKEIENILINILNSNKAVL
ncbi:alpha/beta fold hydrolase [Paenibacillus macquariensis]|uniref:Alpha/beta hydrolase n=1 Tax=Paenibacillus macquariensis TaxID=948756 RepID=A0ABY1JW56_9BACL|nr:alpha/beta hydrolase [Paenibacillus macquariensis]MEC0094354.1 alpha/beta hydrolase [Paenibacillus macquariensis]SIQ87687.1 hypothetical protein SAMN05421578_104446 [Paenibacillus macquariensis]